MKLPERVWLLRHAETTAPHVLNGSESDVELSEFGKLQAQALGEWFQPSGITAVVSSAMKRTIATAKPIAERSNVPHSIEPALHERRIGHLSGQRFDLASGPWAETVHQWTNGNGAFTTPGAESFDEIANRVVPAWDNALKHHPDGRVVVVAHGIVCKVLLLMLLEGYSLKDWNAIGRSANGSISEFAPLTNGKWRAIRMFEVPRTLLELNAQAPDQGPRSEG